MKLRKCLLWQTQRPSIGITSRACRYDSRRFIGTPTGKRSVGWIEIHPFDSFPRCEKKYKGKEGKQLERFHGIHRKIRGTVNVAQQAG